MIEGPELVRDGCGLDALTAGVEGRALDRAGHHDLADIDPLSLEPLGEQADKLVLGRVGEGDAITFMPVAIASICGLTSPNAPLVTRRAPSAVLARSESAS